MTFEISKYALMDRVREKKEIEDAIAAANSGGGGSVQSVTTGASPNILTNITADIIEVTTGGTAGDEFLGIKKYDVGSDAAIENVGKIIRVKVVARTNVSDVPRLLQIETVGSNTQLFCILPDETVVAELVDTDAGVALSTNPDEFLTLIWGGAKWFVDLSRSPGFNSEDFTFHALGGSVSVTDAGNDNIVVNPSPGTGTFTLDLSDILSNIVEVTGPAGDGVVIRGGPASPGEGQSGQNSAVTASDGTNSASGAAGPGGSVVLNAGNPGNATAGTGDGGNGGSVILSPTYGGTSAGGDPGIEGTVIVYQTPVFNIDGHLLAGGYPTTNQNDGTTVWVDLAAGRVLKMST